MKRGFETSEGQLAVVVIVGQFVAAIVQAIPPEWSAGGITATSIAYALSRGFTKAGGAEAFDELAKGETVHTHTPPIATPIAPTDPKAARRAELQAELAALDSP